jgi:AraC family transcriptional regulator
MEWTECLRKTIDYIENHLLEEIHNQELGKESAISPFYLQKGFKVMTGITISEYIRNRRLYLAALDLILNDDKIIDVALLYGYESAESFTRALCESRAWDLV